MNCTFKDILADIFEDFRNKCIEIYELDPADFLSACRLAWQACLRKTGIKLELSTDVNMLLMELEVEYVIEYIDMQKHIINTSKVIMKIKIRHILYI